MTDGTALSQPPNIGRHLKRTAFIVWAALIPIAILQSILPDGSGGGQGPVLLWLALLSGYWAASTIILVSWLLGSSLLRLRGFHSCFPSRSAEVLFALGVGLFILYGLLLVLVLLGLLNSAMLAVILLAAALLWFLTRVRVPDLNLTASSHSSDVPESFRAYSFPRKALLILTLFAGASWIVPYLAQTLLPNTDWDGAMYHLPLTKRFLVEGLWATDPGFEQFNFAGAVHLFYAVFQQFCTDRAIIPFNFLIALAVIATVYSLARDFWGPKTGILAAAVAACVNLLWELSVDPRIEIHLTLFALLACYAFLLWERRPERAGLLVVMGMMLGMAMSIKFTAVFFVFVLGLATAALLLRRSRRSPGVYRALAVAALFLIFPSVFWYARNTLQLGDPIYPLLHGPVYQTDSGEMAALKPAVEKLMERMPPSAEAERQLNQAPSPYVPGNLLNWWKMLWYPHLYARKPLHWISPFLLLFFIAPLFQRDVSLRWLYGIALAIYLLIAPQTSLVRYALPALPLFAVGAGVVLARIRPRWGLACVAGLLAVNLAVNSAAEFRKIKPWHPLHWLRDAQEELRWVCHAGYNGATAMPILIDYVNDQIDAGGSISADDTIFMVGEGKGYLLKCHSLPDSSRNGRSWLAELVRAGGGYHRIAQSFEQRGIRYLLVDEAYFAWVVRNVPLEERYGLAFSLYHLGRFTNEYADLMWNEVPTLKLYRLKPVPRELRPRLSFNSDDGSPFH